MFVTSSLIRQLVEACNTVEAAYYDHFGTCAFW